MLPTLKRQNNWLPNFFNEFFHDDWFSIRNTDNVIPAINVKENEKQYIIEMAAPGMSKEDFHVHLNDKDQLVISVEKKHENQPNEEPPYKYLRQEFNYAQFVQTMLLPEHVDKAAITAHMCSGVLKITLPKLTAVPQKKSVRSIEVQ